MVANPFPVFIGFISQLLKHVQEVPEPVKRVAKKNRDYEYHDSIHNKRVEIQTGYMFLIQFFRNPLSMGPNRLLQTDALKFRSCSIAAWLPVHCEIHKNNSELFEYEYLIRYISALKIQI